MNAAMPAISPDGDHLSELGPSLCVATLHPEGPCRVAGLEAIIQELERLAMAASVRRDARLGAAEAGWEVVAEGSGVRVVVPA